MLCAHSQATTASHFSLGTRYWRAEEYGARHLTGVPSPTGCQTEPFGPRIKRVGRPVRNPPASGGGCQSALEIEYHTNRHQSSTPNTCSGKGFLGEHLFGLPHIPPRVSPNGPSQGTAPEQAFSYSENRNQKRCSSAKKKRGLVAAQVRVIHTT